MLRALALLAVTSPAFAGVRTVAPSGADHVQISAAIAAARPGDVVLVRAGTYAPFAIDGFGLTVVADTQANVVVQGPIVVQNVPAASTVALTGLRIGAMNTTAVTLRDCAGAVRLADLQAWVAPNAIAAALPTVRVERCADVALSRCTLDSAASPAAATIAGSALRATESTLAIHDSTLHGGFGLSGAASGQAGGSGGVALDLVSGTAFVSGAILRGGPGGAGGLASTGYPGCSAFAPRPGGAGGHGLVIAPGAVARVLDASISGGAPGLGATTACGQHAPDGAPGAVTVGTSIAVMGSARTLNSTPCAREGQGAGFGFRGLPGERVFLFLSDGSGQAWNPALAGPVLVRVPFWRRVLVATLGTEGTGSASIPVPELGPGTSARTLFVQGLFVSPDGTGRLAAARPLVLLDAAY
ncbi:MAG: hypothetical protein NTY35_01115 [Planctomycetota bacterium]|nr:hypothetical protein [Planctomycetota bacterium]